MPVPAELFLSYSDADRDFASEIGHVLETHGVPFWFSRRNIRGGQQWHDEIGAALARCDWFLVILSPASVESMWVRRELLYALREPRYDTRIVPVLYKPCEYQRLSWTLDLRQFVDFSHDFDDGCQELLRIWGLGYIAEVRR